jgi:hypothetical protein
VLTLSGIELVGMLEIIQCRSGGRKLTCGCRSKTKIAAAQIWARSGLEKFGCEIFGLLGGVLGEVLEVGRIRPLLEVYSLRVRGVEKFLLSL